ncbi:MAG: hypothetical protein Q9160_007239 [Pyrenula sp. 1 TL-2023]
MIARKPLLFSALFLLATLLVLMSRSLNDSPSTLSLPRVDLLKNLDLGLSKWAPTHNPDSAGESIEKETHSVFSGLHSFSSSHEDGLAPPADKTFPSSTSSSNPLTLTDLNPTNHSQINSRARIGMTTMVFGATNPTYERALRTHQVHAQHHNMPLFTLRKSILEIMYNKPMYILDLLLQELKKPDHERLEWLFWFDADTVIVNPQIPPSAFLPPRDYPHIHLLAAEDVNGLNAGVFFLRVCDWSVSVMAAVLAYRTFHPETPLRFDEQSALDLVLREKPFRHHIALYPQRWFNAYQVANNPSLTNESVLPWQLHRGDMMVHFAGVPDKTERMDFYADIFEQHLPEWEVELRYTTYPGEMEEFWRERREREREGKERVQGLREEARRLVEEGKARLKAFGEGLERGQREGLERAGEELKVAVEEEDTKGGDGERDWDVERIEDAMRSFTEASSLLTTAESDFRKSTLRHAHQTILTAEKICDKYSPSENTTSLPFSTNNNKDLMAEPHKLGDQATKLRNFLIENPTKMEEIRVATRALERAVQHFREVWEPRILGVGSGGGNEGDTGGSAGQGVESTGEDGKEGEGVEGQEGSQTDSISGHGASGSLGSGSGSGYGDGGNDEHSGVGNAATTGQGFDDGTAEAGGRHGEGDGRGEFER